VEAQRAAGGVDQPHQRADQRRLAAARLAHHAEGLALEQVERHVVDRVHVPDRALDEHAGAHREQDLEVAGLE
jgi:hypothetical protein